MKNFNSGFFLLFFSFIITCGESSFNKSDSNLSLLFSLLPLGSGGSSPSLETEGKESALPVVTVDSASEQETGLNTVWSRVIPDSNFGWMSDESVAGATLDSQGNIYVTGSFWGNLNFGNDSPTLQSSIDPLLNNFPPPSDIFLAKLDAKGKTNWARKFGDYETQYATSVSSVTQKDEIVIAGAYKNQLTIDDFSIQQIGNPLYPSGFLAMFNSITGKAKWVLNLGNNCGEQTVHKILSKKNGNLLVAGTFTCSILLKQHILLSHGSKDIFVAELNRNGEFLWYKTWGGESNEVLTGFGITEEGNLILVGYFGKQFSFSTQDGSNSNLLSDAGGGNLFIASLNSQGEHLWSKSFGDNKRQEMRSFAMGKKKFAISGPFSGKINFGNGELTSSLSMFNYDSADLYLAEFDINGELISNKHFSNGVEYKKSMDIFYNNQGQLHLSGGFQKSIQCDNLVLSNELANSKYEIFLFRLDKNVCLSASQYKNSSDQYWLSNKAYFRSLNLSSGGILFYGQVVDQMDFSAGNSSKIIGSGRGSDIFLLKLE